MLFDSSMMLWVPLALGVIFLLLNQIKIAFGFVAITLVIGLILGRIDTIAIAYLLVGFGIAHQSPKLEGWLKSAAYGFLVFWSLGLFIHYVPGFENLKVLDMVLAGPDSAPFSMYLNLDKPLATFALFLACPTLLGKPKTPHRVGLILVFTLLASLLPIATILGALDIEFNLPSWWWLFVLNNLLLTCVAEEALFRGYIQQLVSNRLGWIMGILITSVLFGIAHFTGGILLVVFATLAGIGYGLVFHLTGRLWAAILVHFLFNLTHLTLFTFPVLAK